MTVGKIDISETLKSVETTLREDKSASPQMRAMMELLVVVINLLVAKLGLNSNNSSTPPSKDPYRKKNSKKKGKAKPGGQNGHEGTTLTKVATPDHVQVIPIDRRTLPKGKYKSVGFKSRQVVEIKISTEVTEYRAEILEDENGKQFVAEFPNGVTRPIQYGSSVKTQAVYTSLPKLIANAHHQNPAPVNVGALPGPSHGIYLSACVTSKRKHFDL